MNGLQVVEVTYEASRFCQETLCIPVPRLDPPKEAVHRLRIAQGLNPDLKRHEQKKTFDGRWFFQASILSISLSQLELLVPNLVSKNERSVIVRSSTELFYIGQILDISTTVLR